MCRSQAEGGARCEECNKPEVRAARRRARLAAKEAPEGGIGMGGGTTPNVDPDHPVLQQWDVEQVQALAREVSAAARIAEPFKDDDGNVLTPDQMRDTAPSTGVLYSEEEIESQAALLRMGGSIEHVERAIITAGEAVARKAEGDAGVTAEEAQAAYENEVAEATQAYEDAQKAHADALAAERQSEAWLAAEEADRVAEEKGTKTAAKNAEKAWRAVMKSPESDAVRAASRQVSATGEALRAVQVGHGPRTRENLKALATHYRKALAEVRPMGGTPVLHESTSAQVAAGIKSAARQFPADWVDAHNGGTRGMEVAVSLSQSGGYYRALGPAQKRTITRPVTEEKRGADRVPEVDSPEVSFRTEAAMSVQEFRWMREMLGDDEERVARLRDKNIVQVITHHEVEVRDEGGLPPVGEGWSRYEGAAQQAGKTIWRRPKTETLPGETVYPPKMVVSNSPDPLGPVSASGDVSRSTRRVSVHEMSHRFEHVVPGIKNAEGAFVLRRTTDENGERMPGVEQEWLSPDSDEKTPYVTRPDSFADQYMSREYDTGAREVLSTGSEALFTGSYGGLVGAGRYGADRDMRAFVLGVMATVGRRDD